jgi:hypothetical protein
MALNGDQETHRDRTRTSHADKNCDITENSTRGERRVKIHEIVQVIGILNGSWVPRVLTEEHKNEIMAALLEDLCCYKDEVD